MNDYEWAYERIKRIVDDYEDGESKLTASESMRLIGIIAKTEEGHTIVCSNDDCPICTLLEEKKGDFKKKVEKKKDKKDLKEIEEFVRALGTGPIGIRIKTTILKELLSKEEFEKYSILQKLTEGE